MNTSFDQGFEATSEWLSSGSKGDRPKPCDLTEMTEQDLDDWWSGSHAAFDHKKAVGDRNEMRVTAVEDLALYIICLVMVVVGVAMFLNGEALVMIIGMALTGLGVYCMSNIGKHRRAEGK